jgi:hypothetical protein
VLQRADVHDPCNVRARDAGERLPLPQEPVHRIRIANAFACQKLQSDSPAELDVLCRHPDAHAAGADDAFDAVLPGDDLVHCDRWKLRRSHGGGNSLYQSAAHWGARMASSPKLPPLCLG